MFSNSYGALMIENIDTFQRFSNLISIGMTMGKGFEIADHLLEPSQLKVLKNELFNVPSLTYLNILYVEFNSKNRNWILPASLQNLRILNSVIEYDLTKCTQLETLQLTHNKLMKMPILSNPPPPLKELNLRNNPLQEFTLNDIAGYCDLRSLSLDQGNMSFCECFRLIQWIRKNLKEVDGFKFNGALECEHGEGLDCSIYTLQEADILRQKCVQRKVWNVILWLTAIFAAIAVMILACFFINYKLIETRMKEMGRSGEE
ncbi:uncharacterized protein LOC135845399 [Planococcus citri]|uniref:uncharacterized protein LOC135845399 n=1 Tax=Planococcus citri TaxID=170843 RepID=UPI0031F856AB